MGAVRSAWATISYLAEPAVFPPLAVHSKLHLPGPPAKGQKALSNVIKNKKQKTKTNPSTSAGACACKRVCVCVCVCAQNRGTHLREVADTDSPDPVVFYSDPFVLVCELKCCKTTQETHNVQSSPPEPDALSNHRPALTTERKRDGHPAASSALVSVSLANITQWLAGRNAS